MPSPARDAEVSVVRLRFGPAAPPDASAVYSLDASEPMVAWEEKASAADLNAANPDVLVVAFGKAAVAANGQRWLASIESKRLSLRWKPGLAWVESNQLARADVVQALASFAYLEGQLRSMERELSECEKDLPADIERGLKIRPEDVKHRERFAELARRSYGLWMRHAKVAPRFGRPKPSLTQDARKLMAALMRKADLEARSDGLDQRLEACAELYEGATDRVGDYVWYIGGHRLELTIVLLLILEVIFFALDFYIRIKYELNAE
ncbi:MAG: hypothetical protein K2X38_19915 [Gemmataceae bacterium]|nr:hypothetical protein [Gemmataceae bacterium]